jgi:hypothetical protein
MNDARTIADLRAVARWFEPEPDGFVPLTESIGDARAVLIGTRPLEPPELWSRDEADVAETYPSPL